MTAQDFIAMAKPAISETYLDNATKDLATARKEIERLQVKIIAAQLAFDKGYNQTAEKCLRY